MGEFYSLAAALLWAFAIILFKKSGETVSPFSLNLFRVGVSSILFLFLLTALREPLWKRAPLDDYLILFASGIIGIAVSDTLFHMSLNIVGAGITGIIGCLYAPFIIITAFILIGERIGAWQILGMVFVISGVVIISGHKPPEGTTTRMLVLGILWGVLAMATLAVGIVIAKPVLNDSPVLWATAMRQIGCLAVMLPVALISPGRGRILSVFRPVRTWKYTLGGTVIGSFFALIMWIAGMKYTEAGTAAILNQTAIIYVLIFASVFLKEPFTVRKVIASVMSIAGIVIVIMA